MTDKVFVYCDSLLHPSRRVAVTNFVHLPGGHWNEEPASRGAPEGRIGTGATLVGDAMPEPGWALDPEVRNADIRAKFELVCRKCKSRPLPARAENLFLVLDGWRSAGVSEISLSAIAASLQRRSEASISTSTPEPGQG